MEHTKIKAIGAYQTGGAEVLEEITLPTPELGPHDMLVQVKGNAINPVDYKVRRGLPKEKIPTPKVPGYDASGVVVKVGAQVTRFKTGDPVFYAGNIQKVGNYADYQVIDSRIVGKKPSKISHAEASGVPLAFLTAYEGIVDRMGVPEDKQKNKGKTILITPGAGGVGSIAVQIAKHVLGLTVIATASRPETISLVKKLGADHVINHRNSLIEELQKISIKEVDYSFHIWDLTTEYALQLANVIKPFGKLGYITGPPSADYSVFKIKCIPLYPELMFTRPIFGIELERQGEILNLASKLIDEGVIVHTVTEILTYSVDNIRKANEIVESGKAIGKIALKHE